MNKSDLFLNLDLKVFSSMCQQLFKIMSTLKNIPSLVLAFVFHIEEWSPHSIRIQ